MRAPDTSPERRPSGLCAGAGHIIMYGNPAFLARFGERCLGMPAREVMVDLPEGAFTLLDAVLEDGRPLARWITVGTEDWRMTAVPRTDPETRTVYGVAFHLRARSDLPITGDPVSTT